MAIPLLTGMSKLLSSLSSTLSADTHAVWERQKCRVIGGLFGYLSRPYDFH